MNKIVEKWLRAFSICNNKIMVIIRGVFMSSTYTLYKTSVWMNLSYNIQGLLIPRPYMTNNFKYYNEYITEIDPKKVKFVMTKEFGKNILKKSNKLIMGGKWEDYCVPLMQNSEDNPRRYTVDTIKKIFVDGVSYKKTLQYKIMKEKIENGKETYWCKEKEDLDKYFEIMLNMYEQLKQGNYLVQTELIEKSPEMVKVSNKGDEIRILINHNGDFILGSSGTHRLLITSLLDYKSVPVMIEGVHENWIKKNISIHSIGLLKSIKIKLAK